MKNNRKILIWITATILIVAAVFGIWHASGAGGRGPIAGFLKEYDGYHSHN